MTGHDTRRDQIIEAVEALRGTVVDGRVFSAMPKWTPPVIAAAVMPILDAAVAEARAEEREHRIEDERALARVEVHKRLGQLRLERDEARAAATDAEQRAQAAQEALARVRELIGARSGSASPFGRAMVYIADLRRALGDDQQEDSADGDCVCDYRGTARHECREAT